MNLRRLVAIIGVLTLGCVLMYRTGTAALQPEESKSGTKAESKSAKKGEPKNDPKAEPKSEPKSDAKDEPLDVRFARAQLRLAELTLQKAEEMNKKVPGTLIGSMVSQFGDDVELAKLRLHGAQRRQGIDAYQICMQRELFARRAAEAKLKKAVEANQRASGIVSANDLERMRLDVEICKLRMERGRALQTASTEAKLQWQLELLSDDLARVSAQTFLLGQNRLNQF